jgi:hypothetical protein
MNSTPTKSAGRATGGRNFHPFHHDMILLAVRSVGPDTKTSQEVDAAIEKSFEASMKSLFENGSPFVKQEFSNIKVAYPDGTEGHPKQRYDFEVYMNAPRTGASIKAKGKQIQAAGDYFTRTLKKEYPNAHNGDYGTGNPSTDDIARAVLWRVLNPCTNMTVKTTCPLETTVEDLLKECEEKKSKIEAGGDTGRLPIHEVYPTWRNFGPLVEDKTEQLFAHFSLSDVQKGTKNTGGNLLEQQPKKKKDKGADVNEAKQGEYFDQKRALVKTLHEQKMKETQMNSDRRRQSMEHAEKMKIWTMIGEKEKHKKTVTEKIDAIYENEEENVKEKLLERLEKQEEKLEAELKELKESIDVTPVKRRRSTSPVNFNFDEKNAGDNDDEETPWQNNLNIERDNDSHLI